MKKENPTAKITELTTMIAEKWRAVTEKEKKKYEVLQAEAKAKYEKDMSTYEKKYGKPEKVKKIKKQKKVAKWEKSIASHERPVDVSQIIHRLLHLMSFLYLHMKNTTTFANINTSFLCWSLCVFE